MEVQTIDHTFLKKSFPFKDNVLYRCSPNNPFKTTKYKLQMCLAFQLNKHCFFEVNLSLILPAFNKT